MIILNNKKVRRIMACALAASIMLGITVLFALADHYEAGDYDINSSEPVVQEYAPDNADSGYYAGSNYDSGTSGSEDSVGDGYDNVGGDYYAGGGYDNVSGGNYNATDGDDSTIDDDIYESDCYCGEYDCVICNPVFLPEELLEHNIIFASLSNTPTDEAELRAAVAAAAGMGPVIIQLMNDISLTAGALIIPSGAEITLTGGHTLWRTANMTALMAPSSGRVMILVETGGSLTIDGINISRGTANLVANQSFRAIEVENGASLTLANGTISGFSNSVAQGVRFATVDINTGGTFTMTGGHIVNNFLAAGSTVAGGVIGDTSAGGVHVALGASFTMTGGYISGNDLGGVNVDGTFVLNGGTINNNTRGHGAGVRVRPGGQFTMHSGLIDNNWTSGGWSVAHQEYNIQTTMGGGVYVLGNFDMFGGTISRNRSAFAGGGGVLVGFSSADSGHTGVFTMHGGNITNNMAWIGGGVSVSGDGTFIMNAGNITNNEAIQRGGGGGGVLVHHNSQFFMRGGTISGNTASGRAHGSAGGGGFGGGVMVFSGTFTMEAGTISGNTARANASTATPAGSGIGSGGGVAVITASAVFNPISGTITKNTAQFGGGIYTRTDLTVPTNSTIVISSNNATHNTYGGGDGAGVFVSSGTFTMNNGMIGGNEAEYGNSASIRGGGVYVRDGTFNLDGGTIRFNNGLITHHQGGDGRGGGVVNRATFNMTGGTISDNSAYAAGGVENSGSFTMQGGVISNNTATINETLSGSTGLGGGGVQNTVDGTFAMSGGRISRNAAWRGGGIHSWGCTTLSGTAVIGGDGAEYGNTAHDVGGGVYIRDGGTLSMNSGVSVATVAFNTAGHGGGGIDNGGTFTMHDGIIRNNATLNAPGNGGGVANRNTFTMHDGLIENNTAIGNPSVSGGSGGGVGNLFSGTFTMYGGTIRGNAAGHIGGGVVNSHIFTMQGGEIYENTVFNHGGGVCTFGVFSMNAGTIRNNNASGQLNNDGIMINGNGGGIFNWGGTVHITDGEAVVRNNQARQWGGGIMNHTPGTLNITDGAVRDNTADQGGGLMNNAGTINIQNGTISGNISTTNGGGVLTIGSAATFTISGNSTVSNNTAGTNGGGIYISHFPNSATDEARINIGADVYFTGNTAGAGVFLLNIFLTTAEYTPRSGRMITAEELIALHNEHSTPALPGPVFFANPSPGANSAFLVNNFDVNFVGRDEDRLMPAIAAPDIDFGTAWRIAGLRYRLIGTGATNYAGARLGMGNVTNMTDGAAAGNFTITNANMLDPNWSLILTATPFVNDGIAGARAVARGNSDGQLVLPDSATGALNAGTVLNAARRTELGISHDAASFHWNHLLFDIMAEITYEGSTGLAGKDFQSTFTWWIANTP